VHTARAVVVGDSRHRRRRALCASDARRDPRAQMRRRQARCAALTRSVFSRFTPSVKHRTTCRRARAKTARSWRGRACSASVRPALRCTPNVHAQDVHAQRRGTRVPCAPAARILEQMGAESVESFVDRCGLDCVASHRSCRHRAQEQRQATHAARVTRSSTSGRLGRRWPKTLASGRCRRGAGGAVRAPVLALVVHGTVARAMACGAQL
jgi:hypothetical protein